MRGCLPSVGLSDSLKQLKLALSSYGALLKAEYEKFARIVKTAGIQPE